jgi:hypothetical protein
MKTSMRSFRIAAIVALLHLVGVLLTAWYVSVQEQSSGQAVLVWVYWTFIDFPISFLGYFLLDDNTFLTHALLGTIWWFVAIAGVARLLEASRTPR